MERIYRPLYRLTVLHNFYTAKKSNDFTILPLSNTSKVLKTNGMVLRLDSDNVQISYKSEALTKAPKLPLTEDLKLTFGFIVENQEALYFTEFPEKTSNTDIYYIDGDTNDTSLSFGVKPTRHISFSESFTTSHQRATFRLLDLDGNQMISQVQNGMQQEADPTQYDYEFSIQLGNDFEMGLYKIQILSSNAVLQETTVLILDRLKHNNIAGIIDISIPKLISHAAAPFDTTLDFDALASTWYYHIKLTRNFTNGNFAITDGTVGSTLTFSETSILPDYLQGQTVVFESSVEIPKKELPNPDINLDITSDDLDLSLSGLDNPSHHNSQAIIHLKI